MCIIECAFVLKFFFDLCSWCESMFHVASTSFHLMCVYVCVCVCMCMCMFVNMYMCMYFCVLHCICIITGAFMFDFLTHVVG